MLGFGRVGLCPAANKSSDLDLYCVFNSISHLDPWSIHTVSMAPNIFACSVSSYEERKEGNDCAARDNIVRVTETMAG